MSRLRLRLHLSFRRAGALCALAAAVSGCASTTPNLDSSFGQSVLLLNARQTLDTAAWRNPDQARGLDGTAANSVYELYQKSYRAPEPGTSAFTIGVGGH